jgi:hypothetical protein
MWYQRGSTGSYQKWADIIDDQSYTFPSLLPFFKKSVQFTPLTSPERTSNSAPLFDESQFSSSGGPLQVSYLKFASPSASWLARGLNAIGLKELPGGVQDGDLLGWSWISNTIDPVLQIQRSQ